MSLMLATALVMLVSELPACWAWSTLESTWALPRCITSAALRAPDCSCSITC